MSVKKLFPLFSLLALFAFTACNDDDENAGSYLDLSKQELILTEGEATTSTFSFSVKASDANIPYLCLYVDKQTVDNVSKGELPAYLMDDLKKQAEAKGTPFEQYVASLTVKGDQNMKIENLLPGRIYELVAFAVDGTRTADKAEYLFFQTMKADHVDCTFNVNVIPEMLEAQSAVFEVEPSNKEVKWYLTGITKTSYENAIASGNYDDGSIIMSLMQQELEAICMQLMPEGQELTEELMDQLIREALELMLHTGDINNGKGLKFTGLNANTDYKWMAAAFVIVETDDASEIVLCSDVSLGDFKTPAKDLSRMTFDVSVTDITPISAHVTVTPSYIDEKYAFISEAFTEENINMTDEELMNDYVEKNQSYLNAPWGTYKGVQDVPQLSCTPSSHNYVLVFGYDRGITTKPVVVRFDTPAGGDASKTTFDYEPALASPYQIEVNVIPSDLTVPYISVLVPDDEFDKEKYISLIEMQVQNDFQMNAMWNPGMTMTSFLYSNSTYRPGKKSAGVYQDLKKGDSYTICSFAFAPDGKIAAVEEQKSVITVPGLSNASVSGEILGFYDGDEENGLVFGLPDKTKGRVILAMKYTKSAEAKNAWFSITLDSEEIDEMNPEELFDIDIIRSYATPWIELTDSYRFVMCDWEKLYHSFAYAKDENNVEGKVARMVVPAMTRDGAGTIDELKKLVEEANEAESTRSLFRSIIPQTGKQQVEAKKQEQAVQVPYRYDEPATQVTNKKNSSATGYQPTFFPCNGHLPVAHPVR